MKKRPWVIIKSAMSLDGFIGSSSKERLILSNELDFDELDACRAEVDAVMVGANTLRLDDPRLLVKSTHRQAERKKRGMPEQPLLVTFTARGDLSPKLRVFNQPQAKCLIFCGAAGKNNLKGKFSANVEICNLTSTDLLEIELLLDNLADRGVKKLLVEGGQKTNSMFLKSGLVDCLEISIAPFFAGKLGGAHLADLTDSNSTLRWNLVRCCNLGEMLVCRYESKTR